MTDSRLSTIKPSSTPVLDTARHVVRGELEGRCGRGPRRPLDVDRLLLETATDVLRQLRVLRSVVDADVDAPTLVIEVHETAERHQLAPAGAVGVTALLAELLCDPDEYELAMTLLRARDAYADDELLDGAASMLAAVAEVLGHHLGLDAETVLDEAVQRRISGPARDGAPRALPSCRQGRPDA